MVVGSREKCGHNEMKVRRNVRTGAAFTLTELLIVLGIIALLSAITFPVFRAARASAHKGVCLSNLRQVNLATQLYISDYNDTFMLVNADANHFNNPYRDRTWVQALMPYVKTLGVFTCPSDTGTKPSKGTFDEDLIVGDPYQKFYEASLRVNYGYNYLYYSPVFRSQGRWLVAPKSLSQITDGSQAILYVDSVYDRDRVGRPTGGGSYIVIPPCRYVRGQGNVILDTFNLNMAPVFSPNNGWFVSNPNSPFRYGLSWPWHTERMNIAKPDFSVASVPKVRMSEGCDVKDNWGGFILDQSRYAWDN